MKERIRGLGIAVLVLVSVAVLLTLFRSGYFPVQADELTLAWAAKRVALGQVPYADFFCFIPPLTLYGLAAFFKAFGASLGTLRLLTVCWLTLVTLLLYLLLRRPGLKDAWTLGAALLFPALYVTYWPLPSHHWFALGFGLGALLAALHARTQSGGIWWCLTGFLAALSGLCLQTEGTLFTILVVLVFLQSLRGEAYGRKALWGALGFAVPMAVAALCLAFQGALGRAWYDLVIWPAAYYKQSGGFSDVKPFLFIGRLFKGYLSRPFSFQSALAFAAFAGALALPLLCLVLLAFSPSWTGRQGDGKTTWALTFTGALATLAIYLKGRPDWTHLVFFVPVLLVLCVQEIDFLKEHMRPRILKAWVAGALLIAACYWPMQWIKRPPSVRAVLAVDQAFARTGPPGLLRTMPKIRARKASVISLPYGSSVYFYWAPTAPPLDWVMPPSSRCDAPWEYEALAEFAIKHKVSYILIERAYVRAFTTEPSAISKLLRKRYRVCRNTPWGKLFERKPDEPTTP